MGIDPRQNSSTGAGVQRPYQQEGLGVTTFVCDDLIITTDGADTLATFQNYHPITGEPLAEAPQMGGVNKMFFPLVLASEGERFAEALEFESFSNSELVVRFANVLPVAGVEYQLLSLATAINVRSIEGYFLPPLLLKGIGPT